MKKTILFGLLMVAVLFMGLFVRIVYESAPVLGFHIKVHFEDGTQKAEFSTDFDYVIKHQHSKQADSLMASPPSMKFSQELYCNIYKGRSVL